MQYEKAKTSKLNIRSDLPTSISSSWHGANVDALGFNLGFIAERRPQLAVELLHLWHEARGLSLDTPVAPDEDQQVAMAELQRLFEQR